MSQLTMVVACTDRKAAPSTPLRVVRNLPPTAMEDRLKTWVERISIRAQGTPVDLTNLYRGDNWLQAQRLVTMAKDRVSTDALVASAGLGLREMNEQHAPYAATFPQSHPDTVARASQTVHWWQGLTALTTGGLERIDSPQVVLVLSEPYARALDAQIEGLAGTGREVVMFGGWRDIRGIERVRADRQLRSELGGAIGSLLPRMAQRWLDPWDGGKLTTGEHVSVWQQWSKESRRLEIHDRKRLSDREVSEFIAEMLSNDPSMAATTSLRRLRDSGYACEQRRFGSIFKTLKEAQPTW